MIWAVRRAPHSDRVFSHLLALSPGLNCVLHKPGLAIKTGSVPVDLTTALQDTIAVLTDINECSLHTGQYILHAPW